jgi:hypothetical protein
VDQMPETLSYSFRRLWVVDMSRHAETFTDPVSS